MSLKWLNRELITCQYSYALCTSEKKFRKELKRLGIPSHKTEPFLSTDHANATAHHFEGSKNGHCTIICLGSTEGMDLEQVYALLVHEAVHIWQANKELIGEHHPSKEFEAYAIQAISQNLMYAYK
jgi:hypothetical protein